jgi:fatty-acyl-CoA synthase
MATELETNVMRRFCVGDVVKRRALNDAKVEALVYSYKGKITRRMTYEELNTESNRFANAIMGLGVKKGDRVAILARNCVEYIELMVACAKMGAWITPLNFALKGVEITRLINHSESVMFVVEDELVDTVREVAGEMPSVKHYVMINLSGEKPLPSGWLDFGELRSEKYSDEEPLVVINGDDVLTLMYTSGTEAMPKGVMNSHANWISTLSVFAVDFDIVPDNVLAGPIPIFHVAGHALVLLALQNRVKFVFQHLPIPQELLQLIENEKVTWIGVPPTIFINMLMLDIPNLDEYMRKVFGTVKRCLAFGAPMPEATMRRLMETLPKVYWMNYYGQSELSPLGTTLHHGDLLRKYKEANERFGGAEAIGQPVLGVEMNIVDDNNNLVPPGTVGEMVARSPSVMMGYYKEEEKTEETFKGGWHHTGDLGVMDEENFFYFVDRKKDIVKTGGENVSSIEVEGWITKYPKVSECTVVGLPHPRWFEGLAAFVVPRGGESIAEEEIIQHCKEGLAGYKVPKKVVVLSAIPKNPSGKILKRELKEQYKDAFASEK